MATIAKTKNGPSARRKVGISAIAGMLIGLGITAAAAPAVYFAFQENFSQFTEFAALDVQNLNAARDGDRLVITGTIKNVGSTSISSIILEEMSVDDLRIRQDNSLDDGSPTGNYGLIDLDGQLFTAVSSVTACSEDNIASGAKVTTAIGSGTTLHCFGATVTLEGLSTTDTTLVRIDGDGSVVLRIEIEGSASSTTNGFDLTKSVDLTEELALQLRFLAGESAEVTEVYRTSVKRG